MVVHFLLKFNLKNFTTRTLTPTRFPPPPPPHPFLSAPTTTSTTAPPLKPWLAPPAPFHPIPFLLLLPTSSSLLGLSQALGKTPHPLRCSLKKLTNVSSICSPRLTSSLFYQRLRWLFTPYARACFLPLVKNALSCLWGLLLNRLNFLYFQ